MAGVSAGSGSGSPIAVLRASSAATVSTVDDADFVAGQSAAIQALAMQLNGGNPGSYGFAKRRQRRGPEPGAHAQFEPVPVRLDHSDEQEAEEVSRARGLIGAATAGAVAAGATRLAYTVLNQRPPGGTKTWSRTNHRGEPVTARGTSGVVAGVIAGDAPAQATLGPARSGTARSGAAMALAGTGAAAFGGYDDLAGSGGRGGFRGHLGALRHGELTTGAIKLGGIGVTGLACAAMVGGSPADVVINAGLVAGGANLLNLFDLRPGRAIKVAVASGALIAAGGRRAAAAPASRCLGWRPD